MISLCRAQGVVSFESTPGGGYKILMGPMPVAPGARVKDDPLRAKRLLYLDQLGRTLSDEELALLP